MRILLISAFFYLFFNSCNSDNKDTNPVAVQPKAPVAIEAANFTEISFTANWNSVVGAQKYFLDLSNKVDFSSFVFKDREVSDIKYSVSSLTKASDYYYRVRAFKDGAYSKYSNIIKVTTLGIGINPNVNLKDKVNGDFIVGVAVSSDKLSGQYNTVISNEFSSVTAENEMKMRSIYTGPGQYNWAPVDKIVDFAVSKGINIHGHALIWHRSIPDFLDKFTGTDLEFENLVKQYIFDVVGRYKDKIKSWDVVNEAINDNGLFRDTKFSQRMGSNYVEKCFKWAREADPDCILFYNDYGTGDNIPKQNAVYKLIKDMAVNHTHIDGLGFQMHITYNSPSLSQLQIDLKRALDENLKIHFSELDIRMNSDSSPITSFTDDRIQLQRAKYKEVVQLFKTIPKSQRYGITMWGLKDNESWIPGEFGRPDKPLLFDDNFIRKLTHTGFLEGLE